MNNVDAYLKANQWQTKDAAEVIDEFRDEIAEMRGKCIDIGCGPATGTLETFTRLLPAETKIVGADISKTMIDFAKNKHRDVERLSFIELNVEADKLPSDQINAYDNVVSFYCLHWCQKLGNACKNILDLLRPGGHALLVFLIRSDVFDSYLSVYKNPVYQPYMKDILKYIPLFQRSKSPRASFKNMLKEVGFEIIHCSARDKYFVFKNEEALKGLTVSVNPFIERMPVEVTEGFVEDLVKDVIKRSILLPNTDDRSTEEPRIMQLYKLMVVYVRKPNL